jgi:murein DD-endopeptidase MepM/ murein hydrolase activator NlpD
MRLVALACAAALLICWRSGGPVAAGEAPRPRLSVARLELPPVMRRAMLMGGETFAGLLAELGLGPDETSDWVDAARRVLNLRSLPVGLVADAVLDTRGALERIRLTPDWRADVVLERGDAGVTAHRELRPVERRLVVVRGVVTSTLFEAVEGAGEEDTLATSLADAFRWDIDFHREVRTGDHFALVVERIRSDGRTVAYGPILAASFESASRVMRAVYYASQGGGPGYYDARGRPLRKEFLRAPLPFTRITSRYSLSRLHPILGRRMPHWGVDYGAPVGTPVRVTANGTVIFRGWKGGGGNTIEVRHANGYVTGYLHLSRFATGVGVGARVTQGEVIGYVGMTGLATGPHLDYRITHDGAHVNPLTVGREPAPPLPARELSRFAAWTARVLPLLDHPGALPPETSAALAKDAPVHFGA